MAEVIKSIRSESYSSAPKFFQEAMEFVQKTDGYLNETLTIFLAFSLFFRKYAYIGSNFL